MSFKGAEFSIDEKFKIPISFYSVNFESVADFSDSIFNSECDFSNSHFQVGHFWNKEADFLKFTTQSSFSEAIFKDIVSFERAKFGRKLVDEIYNSFFFSGVTFENTVNFQEAEFWLFTNFSKAIFKGTTDFRNTFIENSLNFEEAKFETFARFSAKDKNHKFWSEDALNFSNVEIEKPDRIFFQTVQLKPDSFINTDIRKFDFTDIRWKVKDFAGDWARFKDIAWWTNEARARRSSYKSLEKVYRRFATFAEDNNDYQSASSFRYTAFDIQRITPWFGRLPITLLWWYKWTSGYGERWLWSAFVLLILILAIFPFIYTRTNFQICPKEKPIAISLNEGTCKTEGLSFDEAIAQSLTTATLQNVDYRKPTSIGGEILIILEKILAPLQAALLALAIRRKFMR